MLLHSAAASARRAQAAIMEELIPKVGTAGQEYFEEESFSRKSRAAHQTRLRYTFRMRSLSLSVLLLSACTASTINYAGKLSPVKGMCDPDSEATLTLRGGKVIFAPAAGTLLLQGDLTGIDVAASLTVPDANKHPYTMTFRGTQNGAEIQGTYQTPRCTYSALLQRTQD